MATRPSPEGNPTRWIVIKSKAGHDGPVRTRARVTDTRGQPLSLTAVTVEGNHQLHSGVAPIEIARAAGLQSGEIALVRFRDARPKGKRKPPDQEDQTGSFLLLYQKDKRPKISWPC